MSVSQLTITTKPSKSSLLTTPPSPFSPKFPITPPSLPPRYELKVRRDLQLPSPPAEPLRWLWACHKCGRIYRLSVTRRCLDDGHYFCAGTTTVKRSKRSGYKKTIRHVACQSEFDYQGYKNWGVWRRDVHQQIEAAETLEQFLKSDDEGLEAKVPARRKMTDMGCWMHCDYPSECRWGKQYGVQTPTVPVAPSTETTPEITVTAPSTVEENASLGSETKNTTFDDILLDISDIADEIMSEGDVEEQQTPVDTPTSPTEERKPSMDELLESAKRRKRRSTGAAPSPLASNPPSPSDREVSVASSPSPSSSAPLQRAFDDFELDLRKSIGRAGSAVSSFFGRDGSKDDTQKRWSRKRSIGT